MRNFRFKDKLKEIYDHILVVEDGGETPEENGENTEQVSAPENVAEKTASVPTKTVRTAKNRRDLQKAKRRKRRARK